MSPGIDEVEPAGGVDRGLGHRTATGTFPPKGLEDKGMPHPSMVLGRRRSPGAERSRRVRGATVGLSIDALPAGSRRGQAAGTTMPNKNFDKATNAVVKVGDGDGRGWRHDNGRVVGAGD